MKKIAIIALMSVGLLYAGDSTAQTQKALSDSASDVVTTATTDTAKTTDAVKAGAGNVVEGVKKDASNAVDGLTKSATKAVEDNVTKATTPSK